MLAVIVRGIDQISIHAGAIRRCPRREDAALVAGLFFHPEDAMRHQDLNPPGIVKIAMSLEEELAQKIRSAKRRSSRPRWNMPGHKGKICCASSGSLITESLHRG